MTTSIRLLTQQQRQDARRVAHEGVVRAVSAKPVCEQFIATAISKYPPAITRLISGLCLVLLLAREDDWGSERIEGELLKLGYGNWSTVNLRAEIYGV